MKFKQFDTHTFTASEEVNETSIGKNVRINNSFGEIADVLTIDGDKFISIKIYNDPIFPELNLLIQIE